MTSNIFTKTLFMALFCFSVLNGSAQDTTVVKTFLLDENSTSGDFTFPDDPNQSYRKILMTYQMRCHDAAVGNGNVGCHEWDYHCNTVLTDSSRLDSLKSTHPSHIIAGQNVDQFDYVNGPTYTYLQFVQSEVVIDSVLSETTVTVGDGMESLDAPFSDANGISKTYMLYTLDELQAAGLTAGDLSGLELNIDEVGSDIDFLKIRMKSSAATSLSNQSIELEGFTNVYFLNTPVAETGWLRLNFHTPFAWNGDTGILVEVSYSSNNAVTGNKVAGELTTENQTMTNNSNGAYLAFDGGNDWVDVPDNAIDFSEGFTVQAWVFYDELQHWSRVIDFGNGSGNDNILFANRGTTNDLRLNVYDGGSGSDIQASGVLETGRWMHLAGTISPGGAAALYVDGVQVSTGSVNFPNTILRERCYIGRSNWGNDAYFKGNMMEVQVWNKALSANEIQEWMHRSVDATHPSYDNLAIYYKMNEGAGTILADGSTNALTATTVNSPSWQKLRGDALFHDFTATNQRPNINWVQGEYLTSINEITLMDSIQNASTTVVSYELQGTDVVAVDTVTVWQAGDQPVLDENGNGVGTVNVPADGTINITNLEYFRKHPARYELLSFITPYGNGLSLGQQGKTWTFDVTDFAPLLKGEKHLSIEGAGRNNEELEITFHFIHGTPPADVLNIQNIWPISREWQVWYGTGFGDIYNDRQYEPRMVPLDAAASHFKVRSAITGHGQNGEFTSQTHYIDVNGGTNEFEYDVWKECASNPVYPQGGTWIFDRAGWCPGMATDVHEFTLTPFVSPGETVELDYGISSTSNLDAADYRISNQLVTYGAANFQVDAEIVDILRPSQKVEHERFNPVCNAPQLEVRNTGATAATALSITYGVEGVSSETFEWTGHLNWMESTIIDLPVQGLDFWGMESEGAFFAEITAVNGTADENADNDRYVSAFEMPIIFDATMELRYKTNNRASDNSYTIKDSDGNVVLSKGGFLNNTNYVDELDLPNGCYTFEFLDTQGDGLEFWFFSDYGVGSLRFYKDFNGTVFLPVKTFDPDFGNGVKFDFIMDLPVSTEEQESASIFSVYPNPVHGEVFVELHGANERILSIDVLDVTGKQVQSHAINDQALYFKEAISLNDLQPGMYMVRVQGEQNVWVKSLIVE